MNTTDPGPKSFADASSAPVYHLPLMMTFVRSLLCECSGLLVPAGTCRTCVYGPDWGSPVKMANFMVGRSGSVDHFSSWKDCIIGVLVGEDFSTSSAHNGVITKSAKNSRDQSFILEFLRRVLKKDHSATEFRSGSKV